MKNDKQNTTSYSKTMDFESFRRGCILSRSNISFLKSNLMCSSLSMQIANIAMYELHIRQSSHYTSSHSTVSLQYHFQIGPKKFACIYILIFFYCTHFPRWTFSIFLQTQCSIYVVDFFFFLLPVKIFLRSVTYMV